MRRRRRHIDARERQTAGFQAIVVAGDAVLLDRGRGARSIRLQADVRLKPDTLLWRTSAPIRSHIRRYINAMRVTGVCLVLSLIAAPAMAATRLIDAVKRGDVTAVRSLIASKSDVNAPDADGSTALHWAARARRRGDGGPADRRRRERESHDALQHHAAVARVHERQRGASSIAC